MVGKKLKLAWEFVYAPDVKRSEIKKQVWQKGIEIPGKDPRVYRLDANGSVMRWSQYGNRKSKAGWEIDHVRPLARGGKPGIENLQPLQWKNNVRKGDE